MPWFRLVFLITVLAMTSGYRFRCYWFCIDQTSTQNDYIEQRDRCREYSELKIDMAMRDAPDEAEKTRKSKLVSLFSECMANNGWTVPDGKDKKPEAAAGGVPGTVPPPGATAVATPIAAPAGSPAQATAPLAPAVAATARSEQKASISRSSECAFARHAAAVSANAAARAAACDLECAQRLKAAPEAPRPAACPSEQDEGLATGVESR